MKIKPILIALSIILATALILGGCETGTSTGVISGQQEGISVSGQGKVFATPDIANLTLGIQAQAATVSEAQSQATSVMNEVMAALTANGIAEKDIQTSYFNIQRVTQWDSNKNQEVTVGYMVNNQVTVKIRQVENAGTIIDAVASAGGDFTRINNIQFSIDDPLPYYDQARAKAMADVKDRAQSLAKLAGVTLGKLVYVTESSGQVYPQVISVGRSSVDSAQTTPISAGELEIDLTVQAVYSIK